MTRSRPEVAAPLIDFAGLYREYAADVRHFALYLSLPLHVTFNRAGFRGLLIEDWLQRVIVIAVAGALWVVYWRVSRRIRV